MQVSSLDSGRIKTASIVRFALRYLVTVKPAEGKHSLFEYWTGDKEKLLSIDDRELQNYVKYCSEILREYFGAVRKNMRKYWDDDTSKLLSVISLNGFIIALTRQLSVNGVQDFDFTIKYLAGGLLIFLQKNSHTHPANTGNFLMKYLKMLLTFQKKL